MAHSRPSRGIAVYEAPPLPDGFPRGEVVRIIDPLGLSAGWVSPARAGGIIGAFVRPTPRGGWIPLLSHHGDSLGCEILAHDGDAWVPAAGAATGWSFTSRDPTAVTSSGTVHGRLVSLTARCDDGVRIEIGEPGWNDPGVRLRFHARIATMEQESGEIRLGLRDDPVGSVTIRTGPGWTGRPVDDRRIEVVPDGTTTRSSTIVVISPQFVERPQTAQE